LQKAMSEGITFVAGSCETGAAGCDAKTFPSVRELPIRFARLLSRCLWEHDKSSGSCQVESRFSVETTGLVTQPTLLVLKLANKSPEPGLGPAIQLISGPQDFSTVPDFFRSDPAPQVETATFRPSGSRTPSRVQIPFLSLPQKAHTMRSAAARNASPDLRGQRAVRQ
jgi:hypothetical protein